MQWQGQWGGVPEDAMHGLPSGFWPETGCAIGSRATRARPPTRPTRRTRYENYQLDSVAVRDQHRCTVDRRMPRVRNDWPQSRESGHDGAPTRHIGGTYRNQRPRPRWRLRKPRPGWGLAMVCGNPEGPVISPGSRSLLVRNTSLTGYSATPFLDPQQPTCVSTTCLRLSRHGVRVAQSLPAAARRSKSMRRRV